MWPGAPYRDGPKWPTQRGPTRAAARPFRHRELGVAVALLVVADLALWADGAWAAGGFGLALLFVAVPALLFAGLRGWSASPRLGVIGALLLLVVARCVFEPTSGTLVSGGFLVVAAMLALRGRRAFLPATLFATSGLLTTLPSRTAMLLASVKGMLARTRVGNVSVLPIVVPAGLVAIFGAVFALANPVIADALGTAWSSIAGLAVFPSAARIGFWIAAIALALGLLRPAYRFSRAPERAVVDGQVASATSQLVARNALVALNALFVVELALDARYLWSGSPPAGMDTQRYAHEGAFWLTVALVMLTVVVGVMFRGALAQDPRAAKTRLLAQVWMIEGVLLAAGTYRRIAIHVERSGLSDLRIVGILGTTLVAVGVVLIGLKLRRGKTFTWLVRRQLDAFALAFALYSVTPTHLLSARVNVARIQSGEIRPVLHVFAQSHRTESAAALLPLLDHPDERVRQGVAALLDDERERLHDALARPTPWQKRELAASTALVELGRAAPRIREVLGTKSPYDAKRELLELSHEVNGTTDRDLGERELPPAQVAPAAPVDTSDVAREP